VQIIISFRVVDFKKSFKLVLRSNLKLDPKLNIWAIMVKVGKYRESGQLWEKCQHTMGTKFLSQSFIMHACMQHVHDDDSRNQSLKVIIIFRDRQCNFFCIFFTSSFSFLELFALFVFFSSLDLYVVNDV
jgi:hypothetical protein